MSNEKTTSVPNWLISVVIVFIAALAILGFSDTPKPPRNNVQAAQPKEPEPPPRIEVVAKNTGGWINFQLVRDNQTGVEFLVADRTQAVAICVIPQKTLVAEKEIVNGN